jgi:hypothetical protein
VRHRAVAHTHSHRQIRSADGQPGINNGREQSVSKPPETHAAPVSSTGAGYGDFACSVRRSGLKLCCAPEGTRTPNVLIRSDWQPGRWRLMTRSSSMCDAPGVRSGAVGCSTLLLYPGSAAAAVEFANHRSWPGG